MPTASTPDSIFVLIEIASPLGKHDETREVFTHTIRTSHKPGIISAQVFEDQNRPGHFLSLQEWESEDAFRSHMTDSDEGLQQSEGLLEGAPVLRVLRLL